MTQSHATGSPTVTFGSSNDIGGEVTHPAAYAPRDPMEALSDTKTRGAIGAYSALSDPFPTSPTISLNVTPYIGGCIGTTI